MHLSDMLLLRSLYVAARGYYVFNLPGVAPQAVEEEE